MNLASRLAKLESTISAPDKQGRIFRIVTGVERAAEAQELLKAQGFDPDAGDFGIVRLIVVPPGHAPWSEPVICRVTPA